MKSHLAGFLAVAVTLGAAVQAHASDSSLSPEANAAFLAKNENTPGVVVRPSGLQYQIIRNGYGKTPRAVDTATVYYKGTLINGTVFDKTEDGLPAQFVVNQLIPGWTEALEIMREGDEWRLVIPANLAYGSRGAGNGVIPPNQTLVFDLTLVKVTPKAKDEQQDQNGQQQ